MFKHKKGLFISLLTGVTLLSSLAEAVVPNAPGSYVGVTKLSNTSVRISTKDNSDNEDGFYVSVYDHDTSALVQQKQLSASNNSSVYADITGLVCDKLYGVSVLAFNTDGNSSSDTRYFNINSTFSPPCSNQDVPNAPGPYIGVTDINKSAVKVNFLDNDDSEDGFLLFDESGDINITVPKNSTTSPSQTYVTLTGLTCDRVYTIKALAFNSNGNSETSDARSFNIHTTFGIPCEGTAQSPIANAGDDKNVEVNTTINIIGSGTDNDGVIVSYKWEENGTALANTASFDYISSVEGNHTLILTVTDNDGLADTDTMIVTVMPKGIIPPVAVAGADQNITEGETVELNASASYDPNGQIVSYSWSENGTVFANTALFSLANLTVGQHIIQVKVTDNDGHTDMDTLIVNVLPGTNQGVSFHTAFTENIYGQGTRTLAFFISSKEDTNGEITLTDTNDTIPFSVLAGDIEEVTIPTRMMLNGTGKVRRVIRITSEKDIVVVGLNKRSTTTDAFLILPDKLLGTEYYTVGYKNIALDEFALIATEDNTIINVSSSINTLANFDVNLSKGEVYQYQQNVELTGTHISSNKNIAVVSGNQCTDIPDTDYACDHIAEQMLPVNTWEKEFITVPLKTRQNGDTFRIVASHNNSVVSINGIVTATLHNAGEYYETVLTTSSYITSNYPIMVAQYSNSTSFDGVTSDPFMALVPATAQYDTTHIINTPSGFTDYINLVVPTASINDVQLDGVNINVSDFTVVADTSYSSAQLQISSGKHTVTSSAKIGLLGYGFANYDSYGYPSSLRLIKH